MAPELTQDDVSDILQAFEASPFERLDLRVRSLHIAANRAPAGPECAVPSPLAGIFCAAAEAGAAPWAWVGATVEPDSTIGLVRVLDNLTPVRAGVGGTVAEVCVRDGQFVEFGQTLLRVRTAAGRGAHAAAGRPGAPR